MEESYHEEAFNCTTTKHCYDFPPISIPSPQEDFMEVPLSPDSKKYQLKMSLLQEKYEEIQNSNEVLRNRLLQVKKEITEHQQLKRILVNRLETLGDNYYNQTLELPELVETPKRAPTAEEIEREKRRRERKERDRLREKARKAAKREADKKAKMIAEGLLPPDPVPQPKQINGALFPVKLNGIKKEPIS